MTLFELYERKYHFNINKRENAKKIINFLEMEGDWVRTADIVNYFCPEVIKNETTLYRLLKQMRDFNLLEKKEEFPYHNTRKKILSYYRINSQYYKNFDFGPIFGSSLRLFNIVTYREAAENIISRYNLIEEFEEEYLKLTKDQSLFN